jgi:hypothetical protein
MYVYIFLGGVGTQGFPLSRLNCTGAMLPAQSLIFEEDVIKIEWVTNLWYSLLGLLTDFATFPLCLR